MEFYFSKKQVPITKETINRKRYICLDLEMNELLNKHRKTLKGLHGEVIQIGAVMLDENFNYLSEFSTFVKPVYSMISDDIVKLTGISDSTVEHADTFTTAFYKFYCWAGSGMDDITTLCWSDSDYKQLWDEIYVKAKNHNEYREFLKTFVNLQSILGKTLGTEYPVSLDAALKFCCLKFKGQRHTAISDAFNTARIFHKLMQQKKYTVDFYPLWKYTKTNLSKEFNAVKAIDKDFTTSFASFMSEELREKYALNEVHAEESKTKDQESSSTTIQRDKPVSKKLGSLFYKHFTCTKYRIRIRDWTKFSIRMLFTKDMKVDDSSIM